MSAVPDTAPPARRRGRKPDPVIRHPEPLYEAVDDPGDFHSALDHQMKRHGDSTYRVHKAVTAAGFSIDYHAIVAWRNGAKTPRTPESLRIVGFIAERYRLPAGYFLDRMGRWRALSAPAIKGIAVAESRRLAWHLPDDFRERSRAEQAEILEWVRTRILGGGTAYRRYQSEVSRQRFGFRFDGNGASCLQAPSRLREEMAALMRFKSARRSAGAP